MPRPTPRMSSGCSGCSVCSRDAEVGVEGRPPLDWTVEHDAKGAGTQVVCPDCTRRHVRAIEAKLAPEWW